MADIELSLTTAVAAGAFVQSGNPGPCVPKRLWIDTTSAPYVLRRRNDANTGWDTIGVFLQSDGAGGVSLAANFDFLAVNGAEVQGYYSAGRTRLKLAASVVTVGDANGEGNSTGIEIDDTAHLLTVTGRLSASLLAVTQARTANYSITPADNDKIFTNKGATDEVTFALPGGAAGLHYRFLVRAEYDLKIEAQSGERIVARNANSVGMVRSNIPFAVCHLVWDGADWVDIFGGTDFQEP